MMPDVPDIQANVTVLSDIEKVPSNCNQDLLKKKTNQKEKTRSSTKSNIAKVPIKRKTEFNKDHPSNFLYCFNAVQRDTHADTYHLFKALKIHKCSVFCIRKRKYL